MALSLPCNAAGESVSVVVGDWQTCLSDGEDIVEAVKRIRMQTHTGRPCGSSLFLDRLENSLLRVLRLKKRGRKPKAKEEENPNGAESD